MISTIQKYLITALVALLIAAAAYAYFQQRKIHNLSLSNSNLTAELGATQTLLDGYKETAALRKVQDARKKQIEEEQNAVLGQIRVEPNGDKELSPYLSNAAKRLWP
jgi:uncharacterized protein YqgV (UPF0045/DUF77 family)